MTDNFIKTKHKLQSNWYLINYTLMEVLSELFGKSRESHLRRHCSIRDDHREADDGTVSDMEVSSISDSLKKNPQWKKQFLFVYGSGVGLVTRQLTKTTPGVPGGGVGLLSRQWTKQCLDVPGSGVGLLSRQWRAKRGGVEQCARVKDRYLSILFSADTWTEAYIAYHLTPFPSVICYSEN